MIPVLTIPGIGGSGPAHWQSAWERLHPGVVRVEQDDWDRPALGAWLGSLERAIDASPVPPILVAHSLGCLLVAHWLARGGRRAHAALLVAVPDPSGPAFPSAAASFAPLPVLRAPLPMIVVGSRDDPYAPGPFGSRVAHDWGARWVDAGEAGHLNAGSGLGDWAEGWAHVAPWRRDAG